MSTIRPVRSGIARTANGVYVPAMNTKIIEWSSRASSACRLARVQRTRWYVADTPKSRHTVTA